MNFDTFILTFIFIRSLKKRKIMIYLMNKKRINTPTRAVQVMIRWKGYFNSLT